MRWSRKNSEREERVRKDKKEPTRVEPLHPKTEDEMIREALAQNEEKFRNIYEASPIGIELYDSQWQLIDVNQACLEMFGVKDAAELHSFNLFDDPNLPAGVKDKLKNGESARYENVFDFEKVKELNLYKTTKAGTVYLDVVITPLKSKSNLSISGFLVQVQNITERKLIEGQLRTSEERLNAALDAAKSGVWDWDLVSGKVIWAGHTWQLLGFKEGEFDGRFETFESRIHPEDKPKRTAALEKSLRERTEYSCEYRIIWPDKTAHWVASRGRFQYDQTRQAIRMLGVIYDITERKNIEAELLKERDFAKSLVETAQAIVLVLDTRGRIVSFNPYMEEISGYKLEEVLGLDWFSTFVPQHDRERIRELFKKATTDIKTLGNVNTIMTKTGQEREIEWYDKTLKDNDGNIIGLLATGQDITERRHAEKQLQDERNLLRTLIDHIPDAIFVKDKNGRFVVCNKALAEFWERQGKGGIVGKTDFDLFEHPKAQQFFDEEQKVMQTGQSLINREGQLADKTGNVFYGLTTKVPLRDSSDGIIGTVGINHDITEHKKAEGKLLEYQRQLKKLTAQVALAEECERRRIAGELHDQVGQALALAKIKLDALRASATSPAKNLQGHDEVLADVSETLRQLINETRSLTFDLSYPILYELGFETAVSEWLNEQVHNKNGIAVEFAEDGLDKPLDDDVRVLLFRNVRELLINCIKHANPDRVKVGIRRINDSMEITVEDNGIGFDPTETKITTARKAGYGLFSIRENLEELGGHLEIESKPGAGCKAVMTAPLKGRPRKKEE